jgi:hypothetical protein
LNIIIDIGVGIGIVVEIGKQQSATISDPIATAIPIDLQVVVPIINS